jgi:molybdenum cofactor guanylyltransferase
VVASLILAGGEGRRLGGIDKPFLTVGTATILARIVAALDSPPSCAAADGRVHHLLALWPVAIRDRVREHLSRPGPRHVVRFAEGIGMRRVDFPPAAWDSFLNVNTPADLEAARAGARETEALS